MDADKHGTENPFAHTARSLEWIFSAMDAARCHKEKLQEAIAAAERAPSPPPPRRFRLTVVPS